MTTVNDLRICLISVEIFAWGKYGGFGRATRMIGKELVNRGMTVYAVVPRRQNQRQIEELDGIRVLGFRPYELHKAYQFFKSIDADIYHSQEPSLGSYLARLAKPERKHVVTFRDPRCFEDWKAELQNPSVNFMQVLANWIYEDNFLVRRSVGSMDGWYSTAHFITSKARAKYNLSRDPEFLPTPVFVPEEIKKADQPTVCFISRWDRRKRPEIFFELARIFPKVHFLAAGKSRDADWEKHLRTEYGNLPNLELLGFIDQFRDEELSRLLGKSWIMVNTSTREGLPNSFIEAAAHGCAILSAVDPDGFASRFGYHVDDDDFETGLKKLLQDNMWKERARAGYEYVRDVFALDRAIDSHLAVYTRLTALPGLADR